MSYEIIEEYGCGHEFLIRTKCKEEYVKCRVTSNNRQFSAKPAKQGLLTRLFRSSSLPKGGGPPSLRFKTMDHVCDVCRRKEQEKQAQPQNQPSYDFADARAQQTLRARKTVEAGRDQFLCTKCKREGRPLINDAQRAANDGLCCDYGRKEFEWDEKLTRSRSLTPPSRFTAARPLPAPAQARTNSEPARRSLPKAAARPAADQAAQAYDLVKQRTAQVLNELSSLDKPLPPLPTTTSEQQKEINAVYFAKQSRLHGRPRDPVHLDPRPGHDWSKIPGYVVLEQRTEDGAYYLDPGIDFERWETHAQTDYGRIPVPPERPLPETPHKGSRNWPHLQTPWSSSYSQSAPKAPVKVDRTGIGTQPSASMQETPTRAPPRIDRRGIGNQPSASVPPTLAPIKTDRKGLGLQFSSPPPEPPIRDFSQYRPKLASQSSSSRPGNPTWETLILYNRSTGAEDERQRLFSRPRPQELHVPPRPLRDTYGEEWHDRLELEARCYDRDVNEPDSPHLPDPHRLSDPFNQPARWEVEEQDITSAAPAFSQPYGSQAYDPVSPLSESGSPPQPYSPVSPINASRFPEWEDLAPRSRGKKTASCSRPEPERSKGLSSQGAMEKAWTEAYGAAMHWGEDFKTAARSKER